MSLDNITTKEQAVEKGKQRLEESLKRSAWESGTQYAAEATAFFTLAAVLPPRLDIHRNEVEHGSQRL